jgi:hypothetical protein
MYKYRQIRLDDVVDLEYVYQDHRMIMIGTRAD